MCPLFIDISGFAREVNLCNRIGKLRINAPDILGHQSVMGNWLRAQSRQGDRRESYFIPIGDGARLREAAGPEPMRESPAETQSCAARSAGGAIGMVELPHAGESPRW